MTETNWILNDSNPVSMNMQFNPAPAIWSVAYYGGPMFMDFEAETGGVSSINFIKLNSFFGLKS